MIERKYFFKSGQLKYSGEDQFANDTPRQWNAEKINIYRDIVKKWVIWKNK